MGTAIDFVQKVSKDVTGRASELAGEAGEFVRKHPVSTALTVGGGVLAATQVIRIVKKRKKTKAATKKKAAKKKTSKRTTRKKYQGHTKRGWKLDRAKRSQEKHELAYQRRKKAGVKSKSKKKVGKIYYTKKGQPYKILANGRARFIKGGRRKR